MPHHDLGHVSDAQGNPVGEPDHRLRQILDGDDRGQMADGQSLVGGVDESAGADESGVARRAHHGIQADAVHPQPFGIDQHLILTIALAPDGDVGHAGNRHQPRADRPEGELGHLHLREVGGGDADLEGPTGGGERRQEDGRTGGQRQFGSGNRHPFLHQLPRAHQVRAFLENQHHRGKAEHGLGADRLQPWDAIHRVLERHGNETFDLLGRKPGCLGLDLDQWGRKLREDVHGCLLHHTQAEHDHCDARCQHQDPRTQGRRNQPGHHGVTC